MWTNGDQAATKINSHHLKKTNLSLQMITLPVLRNDCLGFAAGWQREAAAGGILGAQGAAAAARGGGGGPPAPLGPR